jgi:hypothetical protein
MVSHKADLIRLLEAELDVMESGGYEPPAGKPVVDRPMFDHSLVCINHWLVPNHEPECCDGCMLLAAVPDDRKTEGRPCHFIRLNHAGDTVHSLEQTGDRERLEAEVKNWLRTTIRRLKEDDQALGLADVTY